MTSPLLSVVLLMGAVEDQTPAAMILMASGQVHLEREGEAIRPARVMDIVYVGDRLEAANGGSVQVVILDEGVKETLTGPGTVTLTSTGCEPADEVTRAAQKLSAPQLTGLRTLAQSDRGGVVVPRSTGEPGADNPHSPMKGVCTLEQRPNFRWADHNARFGYRIELSRVASGVEETLWKVETLDLELEYPEDQDPLAEDTEYRWKVIAINMGKEEVVVNDPFSVAGACQQTVTGALKDLVASDDPTNWLLAATGYDGEEMYVEAREQFRRLAEKFPYEPRYLEALASYHERAGENTKAQELLKQAEQLRDKEE